MGEEKDPGKVWTKTTSETMGPDEGVSSPQSEGDESEYRRSMLQLPLVNGH